MSSPEVSVMWSPSIDMELLFDAKELVPRADDLPALTARLDIKTPDALTLALLHPGEQHLQYEPHFSRRADPENRVQAPHSADILHVYIEELSEQHILEGLAHSLVVRAQWQRRMKALAWGGGALMTEVGIGAAIQQAGSYWGLASIPVAGATLGGLWLWQRNWRNVRQEVPNLDGLESPVRILSSTQSR